MALKGTRGRFSDDDYIAGSKEKLSSKLKSRGKNPTSIVGNLSYLSDIKDEKKMQEKSKKDLLKKEKDKKKKINYRRIEALEKAKQAFRIKINPNSKDIRDRVVYIEKKPKKDINIRHELNKKKVKKGINFALISLMFVVELFTLGGIYVVGHTKRIIDKTEEITYDIKQVINDDIDDATVQIMKGYQTMYLFGLDSRTGSLSKGANADVIMIANLNLETGDAQIISIFRDDYLKVSKSYDKINASYRIGGPELAVKDLNDNLDLSVTDFFAFNWKSVADGINLLGGVDINITEKEFLYMNSFIHETCKGIGGEDAKNPAAHYIKSVGMQHLSGIQAVAYGRLRLMDNDYRRTERQKEVIAQCLERAKTKSLKELKVIVDYVVPQVAYNFDMANLTSLLRIVKNIKLTETSSFPKMNNLKQTIMGKSGDCVVPLNLEKGVKELHLDLFGREDYQPSSKVHSYSVRITELRRNYENERDQKAAESVQASLEESKALEGGTTTKASTNTTKSNTSNNNSGAGVVVPEVPGENSSNTNNQNTTNQNATNQNANNDNYEEEPETDAIRETTAQNRPVETTANSVNQNTPVIGGSPGSSQNVNQNVVPGIPGGAPIGINGTNNSVGGGPSSAGVINASGPPGSNTAEIITPR